MVKTRHPARRSGSWWRRLPGDREVDLKRLEAALEPAEVELLDDADFDGNPFLVKGYIGPQALADNGVRYLADPRIVAGTAWVTGADQADHHVVDLWPAATSPRTAPSRPPRSARRRLAGRPWHLVAARGIEIGHIFQLGRKYADAFELDALGPDAKPIRITMGSYGVGVSRLVGAIAEQTHDELGLIWPREVVAVDVHVVIGQGRGDRATALSTRRRLEAEAPSDPRRPQATPGVKFTDAELIGVPTILIVGRGLAKGASRSRTAPRASAKPSRSTTWSSTWSSSSAS